MLKTQGRIVRPQLRVRPMSPSSPMQMLLGTHASLHATSPHLQLDVLAVDIVNLLLHGLDQLLRRQAKANLREACAVRLLDFHIPLGGEVDQAEALTLEFLDAVGTIAVEQNELVAQVHHHGVFRLQRRNIRARVSLLVCRKIPQLSACELANGLDGGGALVVAVAVNTTGIIGIHVDTCKHALASDVVRLVVCEPLAEQLREACISQGRVCDSKSAVAHAKGPQGVRVHPNLALRQHVQSGLVPRESPNLQNLDDVRIRDLAPSLGDLLQRLLGQGVRQGALHLDVGALVVPGLVGLLV
mmetsp:Transcript_63100/g.165480  ORF Transcript_63100/g.165480 Transcript_63100/m.165480 type:complete len:300 (+) Transcript_63100:3-902(+)